MISYDTILTILLLFRIYSVDFLFVFGSAFALSTETAKEPVQQNLYYRICTTDFHSRTRPEGVISGYEDDGDSEVSGRFVTVFGYKQFLTRMLIFWKERFFICKFRTFPVNRLESLAKFRHIVSVSENFKLKLSSESFRLRPPGRS